MTYLLTALTIVGTLAANVYFMDIDRERRQVAIAYEACVKREYHMTPLQWYAEQGLYPECE